MDFYKMHPLMIKYFLEKGIVDLEWTSNVVDVYVREDYKVIDGYVFRMMEDVRILRWKIVNLPDETYYHNIWSFLNKTG